MRYALALTGSYTKVRNSRSLTRVTTFVSMHSTSKNWQQASHSAQQHLSVYSPTHICCSSRQLRLRQIHIDRCAQWVTTGTRRKSALQRLGLLSQSGLIQYSARLRTARGHFSSRLDRGACSLLCCQTAPAT